MKTNVYTGCDTVYNYVLIERKLNVNVTESGYNFR